MHDISFKVIIAALLTFSLYWGVWWYANTMGYVQFRDFSGVSNFLKFTVVLWITQIILNNIAGNTFTFGNHGFQLALTSFVSLFSLAATSRLGRYSNSSLQIGILIVICLMFFVIWVNTSKQAQNNTLPWGWRLASLVSGLIAAELYVIISIKEEIVSWSFIF